MTAISISLVTYLLGLVESDKILRDTALLILGRRLTYPPEVERGAQKRFHDHRRSTFGDCYLAEALMLDVGMSSLPSQVTRLFRPYRALAPDEMVRLLERRAQGSKRRLALLLNCDRHNLTRRMGMSRSPTRSDARSRLLTSVTAGRP